MPGLVWEAGEALPAEYAFKTVLTGAGTTVHQALQKCLWPLGIYAPILENPQEFQKKALILWLKGIFSLDYLTITANSRPDISFGVPHPKQRAYDGPRLKLVAASLSDGGHLFNFSLRSPFCRTLKETKTHIWGLFSEETQEKIIARLPVESKERILARLFQ